MPINKLSSCVKFHFLVGSASLKKRTELKVFIEYIFNKEKSKLGGLNYIFCSDKYLLSINQQFLKHDYYTDIITFDLSSKTKPVEGEVYISLDRVIENANSLNESFNKELHRVIFHGALHLCGYKDKTQKQILEMRKKEDYYLKKYGF